MWNSFVPYIISNDMSYIGIIDITKKSSPVAEKPSTSEWSSYITQQLSVCIPLLSQKKSKFTKKEEAMIKEYFASNITMGGTPTLPTVKNF